MEQITLYDDSHTPNSKLLGYDPEREGYVCSICNEIALNDAGQIANASEIHFDNVGGYEDQLKINKDVDFQYLKDNFDVLKSGFEDLYKYSLEQNLKALKLEEEIENLKKQKEDLSQAHNDAGIHKFTDLSEEQQKELSILKKQIEKLGLEINESLKKTYNIENMPQAAYVYYNYVRNNLDFRLESNIYLAQKIINSKGYKYGYHYHLYPSNSDILNNIEIIKLMYELQQDYLKNLANMISLRKATRKATIQDAVLVLKEPICQKCFGENAYKCNYPRCHKESLDEDDFIEIKDRYDKYQNELSNMPSKPYYNSNNKVYYYCKDHAKKCHVCNKGFVENDDEIHTDPMNTRYYICGDCYAKQYSQCEECNEVIYSEDAQYDEESYSILCTNCYNKIKINEEEIPREYVEDARTYSTSQSRILSKLFPIDSKTLLNSVLPTIELAKNKKFKSIDEVYSFFEKRMQKPETKAFVKTIMQSSPDNPDSFINNIIECATNTLNRNNTLAEEYPQLKFKLIPVDFELKSAGGGHEGAVFIIRPSKNFLNYADNIQPGAKEAYQDVLSRRGHHHGALGYLRFTMSNDNFIVDNLQTDLDYQTFNQLSILPSYEALKLLEKKPDLDPEQVKDPEQKKQLKEYIKKYGIDGIKSRIRDDLGIAFWLTAIKNSWAPILLDSFKKYSESVGVSAYLTSYEMQQKKWSSIPERNEYIYDKLPKLMGMSLETVDAHPENLNRGEYEMSKIARLVEAYFKACFG